MTRLIRASIPETTTEAEPALRPSQVKRIPRAPGARPQHLDWWRDAVIYQVYPRSFADGNGDGVGDLAGIRAHLDYLAWLGIDAIWLNPWYASPMADAGYDIADYRVIDPVFGTLQDAEAL